MQVTIAKSISIRLVCWILLCLASSSQAQIVSVPITEFVVTGNTLLEPEVLNATLARFKGELTIDQLKAAAQAVQALYRDAGYGGVIAYVPEQTGPLGRATIAVVEGRISAITVVGNSQFSADNIKRSVPELAIGKTPQVQRLDAQIQLANENPSKQLSVTLEPGKQPGEVEARILVVEKSPVIWTLAADTSGNNSTGIYRGYVRYQHSALWDLDHVLSLQLGSSLQDLTEAPSFGVNYRIPMYEQGLTVDIYAAYSRANGGETPTAAGQLDFNGDGQVIGVLVNKQLARLGEFEQKVGVALDVRLFLNDCEIQGLPPGACGSAGESVTVNPLSFLYAARKDGANPAGFNFGFSQNLGLVGRYDDAADFEAVRPGAKKHYWLGRVGGYATLPLAKQWKLLGRVSGQFTADALVPGEQFGIAGMNTVRGYLEREVIGDQGLVGSVELYAPAFIEPFGTPQSTLQLLAFADAGRAWNHEGTPCVGTESICTLASFGVGLRWELQNLQLRLDLGHALKDGNSTLAGENRVSFLASFSF